MAKSDCIETYGTVVDKHPSGMFSVKLEKSDSTILATLAGRLRQHNIKILTGDYVTVEMSPYDLSRGRISYRHK